MIKLPPPPFFSDPETDDPETFIRKIQTVFNYYKNDLPENHLSKYCAAYLNGRGAIWYDINEKEFENISNDEFIKQFKGRFFPKHVPTDILQEIFKIKQEPKEKILDFQDRFNKLFNKLPEGLTVSADWRFTLFCSRLLPRFANRVYHSDSRTIKELRDLESKIEIERQYTLDPQEIQDAIKDQIAKLSATLGGQTADLCAILKGVQTKMDSAQLQTMNTPAMVSSSPINNVNSEPNEFLNSIQGQMDKLMAFKDQLMPQNRTRDKRRNNPPDIRCYSCGEIGHIKRTCGYRKNRTVMNSPTVKQVSAGMFEPKSGKVGKSKKNVRNVKTINSRVSKDSSSYNHVLAYIASQSVCALVDSGAECSCIRYDFLQQCMGENVKYASASLQIRGVGGQLTKVIGQVDLDITIGSLDLVQSFYILDHMNSEVILGMDFIQDQQANLQFPERILSLHKGITSVPLVPKFTQGKLMRASETVEIPPGSEAFIPVHHRGKTESTFYSNQVHIGCIETSRQLLSKSLLGGRCIAKLCKKKSCFRVVNPMKIPITIQKHDIIGKFTPLDHTDEITTVTDDFLEDLQPHPTVNNVSTLTREEEDKYIALAKDLGIDFTQSNFDDTQKRQLLILLGQNRDIFAKDLSELGKANVKPFHIDTGDARPVKRAMYRTSPEVRTETSRQVKEMLKHDIIEPSDSEWQSPVVMIKKKNGSLRFAVDYRGVNSVTKPSFHPIMRFDEVIDTVAEAKPKVFSVIDLASGFWQIPLDKASRERTTFAVPEGHFQFKRLPFGLMNAPTAFQSVMSHVMRGLNWRILLVYLDDIIVFSHSFTQHLHHLTAVFDRIRSANLKIQPAKCQFGLTQVTYLGHKFTPEGVQVDESKIQAIVSFPRPRKLRDVRSFMGLCNYYRRFVLNFSMIAAPLNRMFKKDNSFKWTDDCQTAFDKLKAALSSTPILCFPDFSKEFILQTDASDTAISYILSQLNKDGHDIAISFGGKSLTEPQRKWPTHEKECFAVVEGIKQYETYLSGKKFTIYTDNQAVVSLKKLSPKSGKLGRWAILLQGYDFDIKHKPGHANVNADVLSRRSYPTQPKSDTAHRKSDPEQSEPAIPSDGLNLDIAAATIDKCITECRFTYEDDETQDSILYNVQALDKISITDKEYLDTEPLTLMQDITEFSPDNIKSMQTDDPILHDIIESVKTGEQTKHTADYVLDQGILYHYYYPRGKGPDIDRLVKQLVVPQALVPTILKVYHDSLMACHQGKDRTQQAIKQKYYWKGMYSQIAKYIDTCPTCDMAKRNYAARPTPLKPLPIVDVFSRFHMDFLGPFPKGKDGHEHILLIVDSFSRWCECFPLKTQEAPEVARVLYDEIICRFGAPEVILTDKGQNFMSKLIDEFCKYFSIKKSNTSSYHAQTNSACESMNRNILQALRIHCRNDHTSWPRLLQSIMMSYRLMPNQSTGFSPYELLFGKTMRLPLDTSVQPAKVMPGNHRQFLDDLKKRLDLVRQIGKDNVKLSQENMKDRHDKSASTPKFKVGDTVRMDVKQAGKNQSPKLMPKYSEKLYYISKATDAFTFELTECDTHKVIKSLVNASRLKKVTERDQEFTNITQPQPLPEPVPQPPQPQQQAQQPSQPELSQNTNTTPAQRARQVERINKCTKDSNRNTYWYQVKLTGEPRLWYLTEDQVPREMIREFKINHYNNGRKRKPHHRPRN